MPDIVSRQDLEKLLQAFYQQATVDEQIGYLFTEVAQLDLAEHLPIIVDFWESVLFGSRQYQGNPMQKHIALSAQEPLTALHFERWLDLWRQTVQSHFAGPKAEEAMSRATQIASLMQFKIKQAAEG
ncbi:MAG TPA: sec-independent protein translocase TatC [Cytophagales bacterium]|nr:sec-independent protein translocase TatC [Cytophagales bacterium]HAA22677.1 sec-independent protein translocase TatC [Cytophagales bacterium]HAP58012.1 sec-independent protein translocase TatC [Cytophagales bacterium]